MTPTDFPPLAPATPRIGVFNSVKNITGLTSIAEVRALSWIKATDVLQNIYEATRLGHLNYRALTRPLPTGILAPKGPAFEEALQKLLTSLLAGTARFEDLEALKVEAVVDLGNPLAFDWAAVKLEDAFPTLRPVAEAPRAAEKAPEAPPQKPLDTEAEVVAASPAVIQEEREEGVLAVPTVTLPALDGLALKMGKALDELALKMGKALEQHFDRLQAQLQAQLEEQLEAQFEAQHKAVMVQLQRLVNDLGSLRDDLRLTGTLLGVPDDAYAPAKASDYPELPPVEKTEASSGGVIVPFVSPTETSQAPVLALVPSPEAHALEGGVEDDEPPAAAAIPDDKTLESMGDAPLHALARAHGITETFTRLAYLRKRLAKLRDA